MNERRTDMENAKDRPIQATQQELRRLGWEDDPDGDRGALRRTYGEYGRRTGRVRFHIQEDGSFVIRLTVRQWNDLKFGDIFLPSGNPTADAREINEVCFRHFG